MLAAPTPTPILRPITYAQVQKVSANVMKGAVAQSAGGTWKLRNCHVHKANTSVGTCYFHINYTSKDNIAHDCKGTLWVKRAMLWKGWKSGPGHSSYRVGHWGFRVALGKDVTCNGEKLA